MTPIVRVVKKISENKKNIDNQYSIFFSMKNLKNQITLIIREYSVHAFKCVKNLIIMFLLLLI